MQLRYRHSGSRPRKRPAPALMGPLLLALWLLAAAGLAFCPAAGAASGEYQVKAAFLYNFLKFVEWPAEGLGTPGSITVGILGKDPFGDALDEIKGKSAKGRRIVVQHLRGLDEVRQCDLLFVAASEHGRLAQVLRQLQNAPVLTVADQDGFCGAGGMINLISVKNRVAFEVNLAAANRARFRISSQLLKLARNVMD